MPETGLSGLEGGVETKTPSLPLSQSLQPAEAGMRLLARRLRWNYVRSVSVPVGESPVLPNHALVALRRA